MDTRRQWLLRLGETVVLVGVSGVADTAEALTENTAASSLPPGLYLPSDDHLAHALASAGGYHDVPPGSESDYVRPRIGPYRRQFFSAAEFDTIKRLVALILGEPMIEGGIVDEVAEWVDLSVASSLAARQAAKRLSPQHRALAVAYYGEDEVREAEALDPQTIARDGLAWLERTSQQRHQSSFNQLTETEQTSLVNLISDHGAGEADAAGKSFFKWLKPETIRGFYTSRAGLKELDYKGNYFYAESPGCSHNSPLTPERTGSTEKTK